MIRRIGQGATFARPEAKKAGPLSQFPLENK
jgi:hypothetical protein